MGYYIRNLPNKKSFPSWKLQFVSAKKIHTPQSTAKFPRRTWDIPKDRWTELGFHKHMGPDEARARQRQLNSQLALKRQEERRLVLEEKERAHQHKYAGFIPTFYREEFETRYYYENGRFNPKYLCAWKAAQKMLAEIQLEPSEWYDHSREFHEWLLRQKYSLSYCHKILHSLNLWGFFISRKQGKPFFKVPAPRG